MIFKKKNATKIRKRLKAKYNNANINIRIIFKFMNIIRKIIVEYLYNMYNNEEISIHNRIGNFAIDESNFYIYDNLSYWVEGLISTTDRSKFRCNISTNRNSDYLRSFIPKYIRRGNVIISDRWAGYNF